MDVLSYNTVYALERIDLFRGLQDLDMDDLLHRLTVMRHSHREEVVSQQNPTADVFFILEGSVVAQGYSLDGREVSYAFIDQGGIFGEFAAIDGGIRSASVEVVKDAVIARMSSADFRKLIDEIPGLGLRVAEHLVAKSRDLTQRMFEFGTLSVRQRVQAELLRLCETCEEENGSLLIKPSPTHYQIATRIATHREAVSRELSALAAAGIVKIGHRTIQVYDIERLKTLIPA